MKIAVFGLTISSSWGNGHATLWRGLVRALVARGCEVVFFERERPFYACNRDLHDLPGAEVVLYPDWPDVLPRARQVAAEADVVIATSYCPDAVAATELAGSSGHALRVFYDLDTPVTLDALQRGEAVSYIGAKGLAPYDLVLSYTGGAALERLRDSLGARAVAPLYGHVDPDLYRPAEAADRFRSDLSYIGTYARDRQQTLERLFIAAARMAPARRFLIAGAQYPDEFPWTANVWFARHLEPSQHPTFFASSRATLNVTRGAMAAMGWCPSGRLFEAAACGATIISDTWPGLDTFFVPGREILTAASAGEVLSVLDRDDSELKAIGRAARMRVLDEHTSAHRAAELVAHLERARRGAHDTRMEAAEV